MKKKILVIGSKSYLGKNIINNLKDDYEFFSVDRSDLNDLKSFKNYFEGVVFDALINSIVQYEFSDVSSLIESNFYLGFKIHDMIAKSEDYKLFQFGSFYSKSFKKSELDHYLISKESLINYSKILSNKSKVNIFYLQLEHLIGPNESVKKFNGWLKYNLKNNNNIFLGPCEHYFDFIHINDVTSLIKTLIDTLSFKNEFKFFEVGSGKKILLKDFILDLKYSLKSKSKIHFSNERQINDYKNQSSVSNIDELKDLGWSPKYEITDIIDDI